VSRLIEEPAGFFIYKVESKQQLPLTQVKSQIERQLEEQKMRDAIQKTISSVNATYSDTYFKAPAENEPKTGAPKPATGEPAPGAEKPKAAPSTKPKE
jgi:hypothetical protein